MQAPELPLHALVYSTSGGNIFDVGQQLREGGITLEQPSTPFDLNVVMSKSAYINPHNYLEHQPRPIGTKEVDEPPGGCQAKEFDTDCTAQSLHRDDSSSTVDNEPLRPDSDEGRVNHQPQALNSEQDQAQSELQIFYNFSH